jgi:hypothetical protein
MMKRVLHISICQKFWNDKLPLNVYLKIEHLMWTLVTWLWEFEFGFSNIKQKIGVEKRGNDNCWFHCQSIAHGCAEKRWRRTSRRSYLKSVRALLDPGDDPILKEVLKVRLDIVAFCFHRSRVVILFSSF